MAGLVRELKRGRKDQIEMDNEERERLEQETTERDKA